jgi:hypothetical protein
MRVYICDLVYIIKINVIVIMVFKLSIFLC